MSQPFTVRLTRDFLDDQGRLTYDPIGLDLLDAAGADHAFFPQDQSPVTPGMIAEVDAVLSLTPRWNAETFAEGAERLLHVARFGVGYDTCDVGVLTANDVLLTITPGATDGPVAGGTLAMLLALTRRLFIKDRLVREGRWNDRAHYQGTELTGKVLGFVGFGGAGKALRRLVEPFGMRVLVHDPYVPDAVLAAQGAERAPDLPTLFAESDFVSVHCLLNEETRGLIDRSLLERMKPTAYFLNAARGPIVNEADLIAVLREGRIAGAGLDVFEEEPPRPDNPLFTMDNVVLAPHAVCWTREGFQAIGETAIRSILSVSRGEKPFGLVNLEVWDRPSFQRKLAQRLARGDSSAV
jgi:phosphoglycerate dehydrogenase-like enzyme